MQKSTTWNFCHRSSALLLLAFAVAVTPIRDVDAQSKPEARGDRVQTAPADFVLANGKVVTLDAEGAEAQALAISNERIVYVGDNAGVKAYLGNKTIVFDARGRTVIPGLNETHVHAVGVARGDVRQPFRQLGSIAEIQEWLRQQAADVPDGEWIRLPRVDVTRIRERRLPTRVELDAAAPHHPAVFTWQYANSRLQVLNTAALRAAGITAKTTVPRGGKVVLDDNGEPTGVLDNASALVAKWLPSPSVSNEELLDSLENVLRHYNRLGITSVTERGSNVSGWRTYQELKKQKRLPVRATITIRVSSDGTVEGTERFIRGLPFEFGEGDDWVRIGPLKISVDGGILYGTAFLREPYGPQAFSLYGLSDPQYRGLLQGDSQRVENIIRTGHRLGWQMCSHVTGDAGVDLVLDAVEAAHQDSPITDRRYTLIHAYFPHADSARRSAQLGVCVDTQPAWYYKDGDALAEALGATRLQKFIGLQEWRQAGVKVAINSDHMQGLDPDLSLNPYNPFLTLSVAVSRKTESGLTIGPDQRVSREEALRMMTVGAAYLHFDEERKGTLEVGKLGDLAVLSDDYFTCPEEDIAQIRSVLTVVGGKIVHSEK